MSTARIALIACIAFALAAVAGYLVVAFATFGYWGWTGVHDQDGGGAMAVAYVLAPTGGLLFGLTAAIFTAIRLARRSARLPAPTERQSKSDRRVLRALLGFCLGLVAGLVCASVAQTLLKPFIYESRIAFRLFENAHEILAPLFAVACGFLFARR